MIYWILGLTHFVILVAVVVFQDEIRSAVVRAARRGLGYGTSGAPLELSDNAVLERSLADLAGEHVGALVVLRGAEAIDRHIVGGWELGGKLSEPLLKSIFDPHSLGHDGAVVIEGGKVTRFGVHLPLSKDFSKIANLGTRHSAALGLSERTDALCLVVSENTGGIAVAQGGRLSMLKDARALRDVLASFRSPSRPAPNNALNLGMLAQPVSLLP